MTTIPADQNFVRAKFGVLYTDGVTLVPIAINSSNNGVKVNRIATVSAPILAMFANGEMPRSRDYYKACWFGVSNADNVSPLPIFVDADGAILIDM